MPVELVLLNGGNFVNGPCFLIIFLFGFFDTDTGFFYTGFGSFDSDFFDFDSDFFDSDCIGAGVGTGVGMG